MSLVVSHHLGSEGKWQESRKRVILVLGMLIVVVSRKCPHLTKWRNFTKWRGPDSIVLFLAMVTHAFRYGPQGNKTSWLFSLCQMDASLSTFDLKTLPLLLLSNCSPPGRKEGVLKRHLGCLSSSKAIETVGFKQWDFPPKNFVLGEREGTSQRGTSLVSLSGRLMRRHGSPDNDSQQQTSSHPGLP